MKRKILIFIACVSLIFTIAGCADTPETDDVAESADTASDDAVSDDSEDKTDESGDDENSQAETAFSIESQVIYEDSYISVYAESTTYDDSGEEYSVNINITNVSDETLSASGLYVAVNDMMIETGWYADDYATQIPAGETSDGYIPLSLENLEEAGIEQIGKIEVLWDAFSEDGLTQPVALADSVITTDLYGTFEQEISFGGTQVYSESGVTIYYLGKENTAYEFDPNGNTYAYFFVKNESGQNLDIYQSGDFITDQYSFDSYLVNDSLIAGTCAVMSVPFGDNFEYDENYFDEETLTFTIELREMGYGDTIAEEQEITVTL